MLTQIPSISCGIAVSLCLAGILSPAVEAAHYKVVLLGGQSNMLGRAPSAGLPTTPFNFQEPQDDILFYYGSTLTTLRPGSGRELSEFGPEVTFGRSIADALPTDNIALIKYAAGGTALYNDWAPGTGSNYSAFRDTVAAGLSSIQGAGHTTEIVGMLWHQGESDAIEGQQASYHANLTAFITDIRSRYGADLPFLIGEIRRSSAPFDTVADAQIAVAAADAHAAFVPANDLGFSDLYHFDAPSQVTLGQRFASSFVDLDSGQAALSLLGITDDQGGGPVTVGTTVTYSITFSRDMDETTVSSADFENAGTATVSFGTISETAPGIFSLAVTPTLPGSLRLQVVQDAVLLAATGDPLDTTSPISDDTTINVLESSPEWITGASIEEVSSLFNVNRSADNIINGNGFTEDSGFHSNAGGDGISWTSSTSSSDPLGHFVIIDLEANYNLNLVKIWNWNTANTLSAGSKDIDLSVASSVGGTFTPVGSYVLNIGPGMNNIDFGQSIDLSGFVAADDVRLLRIDINSNQGWSNPSFPGLAGLSEIRFSGSSVATNTFSAWISDPAFGLDPARRGFDFDADGDGLANGVEAWFGTHPGQFNAGLTVLSVGGTTAMFIHPEHGDPPSDLSMTYQWSPNLIDWFPDGSGPDGGATVNLTAISADGMATVTAEASEKFDQLFIRARVEQTSAP